jgi:hypothetical protein
MNNFLTQVIDAFKSYIHGSRWDFEFFIYIFGSIIVIFLLSLFILTVFIKKQDPLKHRLFKILRIGFISSCISLFAIFSVLSIFIVTGSYYAKPLQFSHILSVIIVCIVLTSLLVFFASHFRTSQLVKITLLPVTRFDEVQKREKLSKSFNRMKLWYLFPLLGFLFLLLIYFQPKNLISIVIDNSDTMMETANKGESKYETARDALANTLRNVSYFNHFVITSIDRSVTKHDYPTIISTTDYGKLRGISQHFDNTSSAISYINSIPLGGDSPITEIIFNNLLYIQKNLPVESYANCYLLIITDCRENGCLSDIRNSRNYLCNEVKFNNLFSGDQVTLIDLEDNFTNKSYINNPDLILMQRIIDCGFSIEDGSELDTYRDSLKGVLERFFFDWYIIIWVVFFYLINGIIIFSIRPKNR